MRTDNPITEALAYAARHHPNEGFSLAITWLDGSTVTYEPAADCFICDTDEEDHDGGPIFVNPAAVRSVRIKLAEGDANG